MATPTLIKTKAEEALAGSFLAASSRLPGSAAIGAMRRSAIERFAARGLPHRRVEEWKYTDLRNLLKEAYPAAVGAGEAAREIADKAIAGTLDGIVGGLDAYVVVIVDGVFVRSTVAVDGVECIALEQALASDGPAWVGNALRHAANDSDSVVALNTAYMSSGVALRIADGVVVDKPLHVVNATSSPERRAVTTRIVVEVGKGAKLTLIESHVGSERQDNAVTQLVVGDGSHVQHVKDLQIGASSVHLGNWLVRMGADAVYQPMQVTIGNGLVRHGLDIRMDGEGSRFDLAAACLATGGGHIDTTLVVDHAVANCVSRETVKAVLGGHARGVFQGKVIVRPGAQKTDGKQMARALLLSQDAEFDSKPELEIYADDVVCGHGSTSMELDEDLLFYCRSRGIPETEARMLLVESFIGEVIDRVENEPLRDGLRAKAQGWLRGAV